MTWTRAIEHWRTYPQLRIDEAAKVAGVGERTIEAALGEMETRTIGRIRFVTTDSFRKWLGEKVDGVQEAEVVSKADIKWAVTRMRRGA